MMTMIHPPKLPPKAELQPVTIHQLAAEQSLEAVMLVNAEASLLAAPGLSIDVALLEKVQLVEAKLEKLSLMDTKLQACDVSAARCSEGSFIRLHVIGGRMAGTDLSRSTFKDVTFQDCKLDMANFRFAKLTRVQFINCVMHETDFQAAELTDVAFQSSQLEKVELTQCKLKRVDARSSQLVAISGWQSLKGLTIDSAQLAGVAPQLAAEMGLVLKD